MRIMGQSGDVKIIWDSDKEDEVDAAEAQFIDLTKNKKYAAFRVDKKGNQGEKINKFDPNAEKMILAPALQGG